MLVEIRRGKEVKEKKVRSFPTPSHPNGAAAATANAHFFEPFLVKVEERCATHLQKNKKYSNENTRNSLDTLQSCNTS